MAMMLAATDLGIGSDHSAIGDQEACRRILGIPEDRICAYMLALGYPADRPLSRLPALTAALSTRSSTGAIASRRSRRGREPCWAMRSSR